MAKNNYDSEIQQGVVHWLISYFDYDTWEYFDIFLDAINGIALSPITARDALPTVTNAALYWANDAALVYLTTFFSMMDENGKTESWMYQFYSPAKDSTFLMWVFNGVVTDFQQYPGGDLSIAVPDDWINSDQAITSADSNGGDSFRAAHDSVMVVASLTVLQVSEGEMRAVWLIQYATDTELLEIRVDALTGALITGVQDLKPGLLAPESCALEQNFPNPFNPQTTISYKMQYNEHVLIRIIDLMGREIITLVDEKKAPGNYKIIWDARDDAGRSVSGGVYFYEMKAGSFQAIHRMILAK
ncbi:hypothetical protein BVY01_00590 [bacterium I07]|nr:hypothetical protein BVY01_00590 [bacterium I07]